MAIDFNKYSAMGAPAIIISKTQKGGDSVNA